MSGSLALRHPSRRLPPLRPDPRFAPLVDKIGFWFHVLREAHRVTLRGAVHAGGVFDPAEDDLPELRPTPRTPL
jgi:hypothetical protein